MKHVSTVAETVSALLLAAVVMIVLIQVVARYVFQLPISWPEELARYTSVWLTFIGAAAAAGRHQQITVDLLTPILPHRAKSAMKVVATVCGLLAVGLLVWAVQPMFGIAGLSASPATGIQARWVYLSLPIGVGMLAVFLLSDLVRLLRGKPLEDNPEERELLPTE
jgi:C4-dicarboxylate transporter DctQ subunit